MKDRRKVEREKTKVRRYKRLPDERGWEEGKRKKRKIGRMLAR